MDRWTFVRAYHAAGGRRAGRQFEIEMGQEKTIHDWGIDDRGPLPVGAGLDIGDSGHLHL